MIHRLSLPCLGIESQVRWSMSGPNAYHQVQMHGISYLRMPPQSCRLYLGCVRFSKEEDSFPHVHYDLHFLTRFFLVSQAIVLACLKPLTRGPCLTSIHEVAAVSGRSFPTCESLRCALIAWHLGWQGVTQRPPLLFVQELQTLVSWKMERSALCTDIVNKVPICHLVLCTLDPDSWLLGQRPSSRSQRPSCPSSICPLLEGWQEKEKTELTPLKPQNVLNCRLTQGHKLLWTLLPITAQQPC